MCAIPHHTDYRQAITAIKQRIQASRTRALLAVNVERVGLYWDIGRQLNVWQRERHWSSAVVGQMALDLQAQPVRQMSWGHVRTLLAKVKSVELPTMQEIERAS
jgi:hypothetical protein